MIYLDNAATTIQKPETVGAAMQEALQLGNPGRGAYASSYEGFKLVEQARDVIKTFFKATDYECCFSLNATESLNMAIKGLLPNDAHVITTSWEHNSVLRPLYQLEKQGLTMDVVSSEPMTGKLNYYEFASYVRPNTRAVICNLMSNVTGNVIDLDFIKSFCKEHQLLLIVDASQAAGTIEIDLSDGIITALCFTGHKSLLGPMGIGGLCLKKDAVIEPLITGGDGLQSFSHEAPSELPMRLEAGTLNLPAIAGLKAGVEWLIEHPPLRQRESNLTHNLRQELKCIPNVMVYGEEQTPSIVSFNLDGIDSAIVSTLLDENYHIATRSGYHCAPLMHQNLGTATQGTVRLALSVMTKDCEIEQTLSAIRSLAKQV